MSVMLICLQIICCSCRRLSSSEHPFASSMKKSLYMLLDLNMRATCELKDKVTATDFDFLSTILDDTNAGALVRCQAAFALSSLHATGFKCCPEETVKVLKRAMRLKMTNGERKVTVCELGPDDVVESSAGEIFDRISQRCKTALEDIVQKLSLDPEELVRQAIDGELD